LKPSQINRRALIGILGAGLLGAGFASWRTFGASQPRTRIVVADSPAVASALFYVAQTEGFFDEEGIEIAALKASSGKEALERVIAGEADICMAAEAPFVRAVLAGAAVQIMATIETSERNTAIIVPDASPIRRPFDLRARTVGFCPGTASEYFLSVYLQANGLSEADIAAVALSPKDAHEALAAGKVDALAGWQEIRARADQALGHRTRALYADGVYLETWNVIGKSSYLDARRPAMEAFARALLKAQTVVAADPDLAIDIAAKFIAVPRPTIAEMWPDYAFDVSLDQALVSNLEGHWRLIAKSGGGGAATPDLVASLAPEALAAVEPGRVTVVR
jgi:ABC-type nitrate/sulfonate/bicarbonate transport system substrate-binding protein